MQPTEHCSNVCKRGDVQVDTVGKDTQWGTGGMVTKLTAARIATAAGCTMVICSSAEPELMPDIIRGKQAGTVFHPLPNAVRYILTHLITDVTTSQISGGLHVRSCQATQQACCCSLLTILISLSQQCPSQTERCHSYLSGGLKVSTSLKCVLCSPYPACSQCPFIAPVPKSF